MGLAMKLKEFQGQAKSKLWKRQLNYLLHRSQIHLLCGNIYGLRTIRACADMLLKLTQNLKRKK